MKEYWSRLPFPSPRDLSNQGIESTSLVSPPLAGRFFTIVLPGKPYLGIYIGKKTKKKNLEDRFISKLLCYIIKLVIIQYIIYSYQEATLEI